MKPIYPLGAIGVAGAALLLPLGAQAARRPNVVIVLADDLGWGDVGFLGSEIRTPNLDRLASESIVLDRFYTAPVSSPTRAGLMTGRYPNRFGIRETVIPPWREYGLDENEETLADMMEQAGYEHRAVLGKWHLGHGRKAYYPLNRGFNYFYGCLNGAIDYFTHEREGELDWHKNWDSCYDEGYSTDLIAREAVNYVEEHADEPFLLYVAFNAPHTPLQAKPEDIALYADNIDSLKGRARNRAIYSAMVTCMDRGIGTILDKIDEKGLTDNTIFLFFSDNGADELGSSSGPLRGTKFTEWDGGVRAPAIIRWPEGFGRKHRVVEQVTGFVDVAPTLREIVGLKSEPKRPYDGISVLSVLNGKRKEIERDLYLGCGAVVNRDYKLILPVRNDDRMPKKPFLVDYATDPYESKNAYGTHPAEEKRLQAIAEEYDNVEQSFPEIPYGEGKKGFVPPKEWRVTKP